MDSDSNESSPNDGAPAAKKPKSLNVLPISEFRKEKRFEMLSKRRWSSHVKSSQTVDLQKILDDIGSCDPTLQTAAVCAARKLPVNEDPRVTELVVPVLAECLRKHENPELQRESAWTLKCLVSASYQVRATSYASVVAVIVELLPFLGPDVLYSVVSVLDSIAAAGNECRDLVVSMHVVSLLSALVWSGQPKRTLLNVVRVFGHLCSEEYPPPPVGLVRMLTKPLDMLVESTDAQVLSETAWALCNIASFGSEYIQVLFDSTIAPKLLPLLAHEDEDVQMAALAAIGKILRGTKDQARVVLGAGLLRYFPSLLTHPDDNIREEAESILHYIASDHGELAEMIDEDLMDALIELLQSASTSSESDRETEEDGDTECSSEWEDCSLDDEESSGEM